MSLLPKAGYSHLVLLVILVLFATVLLAKSTRQLIYLAYQNTSARLGYNVSELLKPSYIEFIKAQPGTKQASTTASYLGKNFTYSDQSAEARVLGDQSVDDNKWIEVDLSDQKLYMHEGDGIVGSYLISSGKWASTPTGEWRVWIKLRYARMRGGSKALGTFYDLPNVPYTMYYYGGYGIHGAYWHNNFGQPMSHGCINMNPEEAGVVFNWAQVGTRVQVHE